MNEVYAKLNKCYEQYQKICKTREIDFVPEIALVLGSGLGIMQMIFKLLRRSITMKWKVFRYRR